MTAPFILSFDDGPSEWTPMILDLLAEHQARALFFVTGLHAAQLPEVVIRAHLEGHTVGNHGMTHDRLTNLTDNAIRNELEPTSRLIEQLTGKRPWLFRAPFFGTDERVNAIAASLGMSHVGADVVPDDWATDDSEAVARTVLERLRPGAIVSLHDGIPPDGGSSSCTQSRLPTVEAVRLILQAAPVPA